MAVAADAPLVEVFTIGHLTLEDQLAKPEPPPTTDTRHSLERADTSFELIVHHCIIVHHCSSAFRSQHPTALLSPFNIQEQGTNLLSNLSFCKSHNSKTQEGTSGERAFVSTTSLGQV